ncbi:MAG: DUF4360 domain-containing protein [Bacteriovoracaceae bacterium]
MKRQSTFILSTLMSFATLISYANASELQIGKIGYAGLGCPQGSLEVENLEGVALGFKLESYKTEVLKKSLGRVNCSIAIPVSVPEGLKLVISSLEIKGKIALQTKKASVRIHSDVFLMGQSGLSKDEVMKGPLITNIYLKEDLSGKNALVSDCGAKTTLRLNTSAIIKNSDKSSPASIDLTKGSGLELKYALLPCE